MPTINRPRTPLWTALRGSLIQHTRDARATRRTLERDLATYTRPVRPERPARHPGPHSDEQTADIRQILSRRAA